MDYNPELSVIIVAHRTAEIIYSCLQALAGNKTGLNIEVILVENPPEPVGSTKEMDFPLPLKRMSTIKRLGFAAANNLGAAQARGQYLMFLNPDVRLEPDAIEKLYYEFNKDPDIGLVGGRLTGPDGRFQPSCRRFPTLENLLYSRGSILNRIFRNSHNYTLPDYDNPTPVEAIAASMVLMKNYDYKMLEGFDERFFMYMEDTDLCLRLSKAGKKILYVPQARGIHEWGYSTRKYRFRRIVWHHVSTWRYFTKHHNSLLTLAGLLPLLVGNCLLSLATEMVTLHR